MPRCLASPVCLITMWVKHSWYTRSVQYLISQQRLHDGTDAQTLYVSQESKTHFRGSYRVQRLWLCTSFVLTSLGSSPMHQTHSHGWETCSNALSVHRESLLKPRTEYINCLHPGALEKNTQQPHISDAPSCPLPPRHISSENLTWRVCIGFLHLPFKPLRVSWRWGELRLLSPRFSEELFFMHTLTDVDIWLGGVHRSPRLSAASGSLFSWS